MDNEQLNGTHSNRRSQEDQYSYRNGSTVGNGRPTATEEDNKHTILMKVYEVNEDDVVCDCLIDPVTRELQLRSFPRHFFNTIKDLHFGMYLACIIQFEVDDSATIKIEVPSDYLVNEYEDYFKVEYTEEFWKSLL